MAYRYGYFCFEAIQTLLCITICIQCCEATNRATNRVSQRQPQTVVVVQKEPEKVAPTVVEIERDFVEASATGSLPLLAVSHNY